MTNPLFSARLIIDIRQMSEVFNAIRIQSTTIEGINLEG